MFRYAQSFFVVALLALNGSINNFARGQEGQPEKTGPSDERSNILTAAIDEYDLYLGKNSSQETPRQVRPILFWSNPLRNTPGGAVFLWAAHGRPQAISCIYTYGESSIDHEFQSLTDEAFQVKRDGRTVWEPSEPGIVFHLLKDAPLPADSAQARLVQMRSLARQFAASVRKGDDRHELRLLPQPIYRYGAKGEVTSDGGLFAFVQATDPEVLLLIESRESDTAMRWHFALARMTDQILEVDLNGREVWQVDAWQWQQRHPSQTYIKFTSTLNR